MHCFSTQIFKIVKVFQKMQLALQFNDTVHAHTPVILPILIFQHVKYQLFKYIIMTPDDGQ